MYSSISDEHLDTVINTILVEFPETWYIYGAKRLRKFCITLCWLFVCVSDKDNDGRLTLRADSLEFYELLCSLLCVSMRSLTSSSKQRHLDGRSSLRAAMLKVE